MLSEFILQANTVNKKTSSADLQEDKEIITGYKLMRREHSEAPLQPCLCPVQRLYENSLVESAQTTIDRGNILKRIFTQTPNVPLNLARSEKITIQKQCSSQCVAFKILQAKDDKGIGFKCCWGNFTHKITDVINSDDKH